MALSQKYLFPRGDKLGVRLLGNELPGPSPARFRGRAVKSGRKSAPMLWIDDMEQVKDVWIPPLLRYPIMVNRWNGARNGITSRAGSVLFSRSIYVPLATWNARWRTWRVPPKRRFIWFPGITSPRYHSFCPLMGRLGAVQGRPQGFL